MVARTALPETSFSQLAAATKGLPLHSRIPVHVHATDSITRFGLVSQLRSEPDLMMVETHGVVPGTVIVAAADRMDEDLVRQLRALNHRGAVTHILVTGNIEDLDLLAAIEVGVKAIVPRTEATSSRLAQLAARAIRGEAALPADVLARLLKQVTRLQQNVLVPRGLTESGLSVREREVLRLVADGLDTAEIACALNYSSRTVKNILHCITSRFCLRNRSHAVAYALREGFI